MAGSRISYDTVTVIAVEDMLEYDIEWPVFWPGRLTSFLLPIHLSLSGVGQKQSRSQSLLDFIPDRVLITPKHRNSLMVERLPLKCVMNLRLSLVSSLGG